MSKSFSISGAENIPHGNLNSVDVRKSMEHPRLRWASRLLTWITGKPVAGQQPLFGSPWSQVATAVLTLAAGFGGAVFALSQGPFFWLLLPLCWMLTTGAARKMQVMIIHHCTHLTFSRSRFVNRAVAETLSTLILAQDFTTYQTDHVTKHHGSDFATMDDPDVVTLTKLLQIEPGMSKAELWRKLWKGVFSPRLHFVFIAFRLRTNFWSCPNYRKLCSAVYLTGLVTLIALTGQWNTLVWAWVFPLVVPYQASAVLQFCSRHYWLQHKELGETSRQYIARLTVGRFSGEAAPSSEIPKAKAVWAWSAWTVKMLTYHLFWRVFVVVNSLPEHDWHHRRPASKEWAVGPYARQQDIEAGHPGWPPYEEVWGFLRSIDLAFEIFSRLPKPTASASISTDELEKTIATM